jgi:hypothetical protein
MACQSLSRNASLVRRLRAALNPCSRGHLRLLRRPDEILKMLEAGAAPKTPAV